MAPPASPFNINSPFTGDGDPESRKYAIYLLAPLDDETDRNEQSINVRQKLFWLGYSSFQLSRTATQAEVSIRCQASQEGQHKLHRYPRAFSLPPTSSLSLCKFPCPDDPVFWTSVRLVALYYLSRFQSSTQQVGSG